jgi:hypothetical protein
MVLGAAVVAIFFSPLLGAAVVVLDVLDAAATLAAASATLSRRRS